MRSTKGEDKNESLKLAIKARHVEDLKAYATKNECVWEDKVAKQTRYGINDGGIELDWADLSEADRTFLHEYLRTHDDRGVAAQISGLRNAEKDPLNVSLANLKMLDPALRGWLKNDAIDHWIYVEKDGKFEPELVTGVYYYPGEKESPAYTAMTTKCVKLAKNRREVTMSYYSWDGSDVRGKKLADILTKEGIMHETPELKAEYLKDQADFEKKRISHHHQFTGQNANFREFGEDRYYWGRRNKEKKEEILGKQVKVVNDEDLVTAGAKPGTESFANEAQEYPVRPQIRFFNLETHEEGWMYAYDVKEYVFDKTLRDKLILPQLHRDLIDLLTTNSDVILDDFIAGKSGGTSILCQGGPGLGKTLTAEIYAEHVEKPLYRIHSGQLGISPEKVEESLKTVLARGSRWGACVLIDEADVYIRKRGDDITHNAVVACFLRTLEYFEGLLFMTTNRVNDVDDAIQSRCIAIISYHPLEGEDAVRLWHLILDQFEVTMETKEVVKLTKLFARLPGRDMKELTKLVAKFTKGQGKFMAEAEDFRKLGQFRGLL